MKLITTIFFLLNLFFGIFFVQASNAQDKSNCLEPSTQEFAKQLEAQGGSRVAELKYEVQTSSYGSNQYWKTVSAYKYSMPDGKWSIATCKGILTRNLKKGPLSIAGSWFNTELKAPCCNSGREHKFVSHATQTINVKDYTLSEYGEEEVVFDSEIVSPRLESFERNSNRARVNCWVDNQYQERCYPVAHNLNSIAKVSGNQINASNLQASFSSDGQLESLTVPFDLMAFEAESKAIDQTKTVEIVEDPVGHVKLSPSVLLFSNGQAWQFKIINRTVYNILLTGPITSTFLKPATSSMVDQVVLSTAGPGIIKVELPWSEKLYLELRSKN